MPSASIAPAAATPPPALATFYAALRALERGERRDHVRIAWLGDSHAQADFWLEAVRAPLQRRFGHGGLGFVHVGFKQYRHAGARIEIEGKWRMRPKPPTTVEPTGDGAFGLGGILLAGYAGGPSVSITLTDERLATRSLRWDLCFKLSSAADSFRLAVEPRADGARGRPMELVGAGEPRGALRHLTFTTRGLGRLLVRPVGGVPEFCGVVVETDAAEGAGVVLDNLGMNGARHGTALAWSEAAWAAEVQRRPPELFIVEYGANEASDPVPHPDTYRREALALYARLRRIRPDASCLVVGPADRADVEEKMPPIREAVRAAALEAGCFFWDTYEVMGGRGSLRRWRDDGRASVDGVHLRPAGYAELGALLVADLMARY
jgi:lysophospholipase L1-like esterase